jgi:hypothetical protein
MTVEQMRIELKKAYKTPSWTAKVNNMRPPQVTALYLKFRREGKIK